MWLLCRYCFSLALCGRNFELFFFILFHHIFFICWCFLLSCLQYSRLLFFVTFNRVLYCIARYKSHILIYVRQTLVTRILWPPFLIFSIYLTVHSFFLPSFSSSPSLLRLHCWYIYFVHFSLNFFLLVRGTI